MPHLAALTSLRFFAALSVAWFHLQGIGFGVPFEPLALGVGFFFVLSGFVLTYAYGGRGEVSLKSFYINRIARIWPAHLVTAGCALALLYPGMLYDSEWYPLVLTNLLMLHAWVPASGYVFSLNAATWSISAEMAFYAAFPLVVTARRPIALFAALLLGTVAAITLPNFGPNLGPSSLWELSPQALMQQFPVTRFVEFAAGVLVGRAWLAGWRLPLSAAWMTAVESVALALVLAFALSALPIRRSLGVEGQQFGLWYSQSGGFAAFSLLVYVFAHQRGVVSRWLAHPSLVLLGKISFSLYMVHLLVMLWAQREGWIERMGFEMAGLAIAVTSLVAAFALWRFVEIPAQQLLSVRHGMPASTRPA